MDIIIPITIALITSIFGPISITYLKHKLNKKPQSIDPLQEALKMNNIVEEQLEVLLNELNCDHIWISQFHNGGNFYPTGKSIQKFSIFYEKTSNANITLLSDSYKNVPVSIFNKPLSKLYEDGELLIEDIQLDKIHGLEIFCSDNKYKSIYLFAIDDINDNFIGVLGIYFKKKYKLTNDELLLIRQKTAAIGAVLNTYLYENNKK